MVLRKVLIFAALLAVAVVGAGSASAGNNLRLGSATGTLVPVGHHIHANIESGTTADLVSTNGLGTASCTEATFTGTVTSNTSGGDALGDINTLNFGTPAPAAPCDGTIGGKTIQNATLTSTGSTVTTTSATSVQNNTVTEQINFTDGSTCVYDSPSSFNGTWNNTGSTLTYASIPVTGTALFCPSSSFSVKFADAKEEESGQTVFIG